MSNHSPAKATLIVSGLFAGGLLCGTAAGWAAVARAQDPYVDLEVFVRVLDVIERDYVDQIPTDRLIHAAIEGMVEVLDRQSRWLDPSEYRDLQDDTEGQSTGLGIRLGEPGADGGLPVVQVLPGSPARRDGIEAGDRILEVDGHSIAGLRPEEVEDRFRGTRGEAAVLTILRDGWSGPQQVRTIRDRIHEPSAEADLLDGRLLYARVIQFREGAGRELELAVHRAAEPIGGVDGAAGLVLDVRDNPGGLLDEAVAVVDLFLDQGLIVSTRHRADDDAAIDHLATPGGFGPELPVVVLVNGMSASASEIVAGALQDTRRGKLVGERTFGKGTVQQVYKNLQTDTSALKLTVGRYFTPSGEPVATGEGRAPDIEVPFPGQPTAWDRLDERLGALDLPSEERGELRALLAQLDPPDRRPEPIPWHLPVRERPRSDPQLRRAIEELTRDP